MMQVMSRDQGYKILGVLICIGLSSCSQNECASMKDRDIHGQWIYTGRECFDSVNPRIVETLVLRKKGRWGVNGDWKLYGDCDSLKLSLKCNDYGIDEIYSLKYDNYFRPDSIFREYLYLFDGTCTMVYTRAAYFNLKLPGGRNMD